MNRHIPKNYKINYTFDDFSRISSEEHPCGLKIFYHYNSQGLYSHVIYNPSRSSDLYSFNSIMPSNGIFRLEYDSNGIVNKSFAHGRRVTRSDSNEIQVQGPGGVNILPMIIATDGSLVIRTDLFGRPSVYDYEGVNAVFSYSSAGVQYSYDEHYHTEPAIVPLILNNSTRIMEIDNKLSPYSIDDIVYFDQQRGITGAKLENKSFVIMCDSNNRITSIIYSDLGEYAYAYDQGRIVSVTTSKGQINFDLEENVPTDENGNSVYSPLPYKTIDENNVESTFDIFGRIIRLSNDKETLIIDYDPIRTYNLSSKSFMKSFAESVENNYKNNISINTTIDVSYIGIALFILIGVLLFVVYAK